MQSSVKIVGRLHTREVLLPLRMELVHALAQPIPKERSAGLPYASDANINGTIALSYV